MAFIELPDSFQYFDLYAASGIAEDLSIIITNTSSYVLEVIQSPTQPLSSDQGYVVASNESVLVHANLGSIIWTKSGEAGFIVQPLTDTITPFTSIELPHYLYTSQREMYRRVRVDPGQTGFYESREFRTFKELDIPTATTYVVRVVVPLNVILFNLTLVLDQGSCRLSTKAGGTQGGVFAETLPIIRKNNMSERPSPDYLSQVTISAGGTHSGGTTIDVVRVVAVGATAQRTSVGGQVADERGVGAGTYYFVFENISTGSVTGVFSAFWEERP